MNILVVDDDELISLTLKTVFKGEQVFFAKSFAEANDLLRSNYFNVAFLDIQLKKGTQGDGIDLLKFIREQDSYLPCVMISALDDRTTVMTCLELGAVDYVAKGSVAPEAYRLALYKSAVWRKLLSDSPAGRIPKAHSKITDISEIKGSSSKIKDLRHTVQKMGTLPGPFLILGNTGTGKELVAKALWAAKRDLNRPFIAVNCASLPENLVESELFGYEKGSFTGALATKTGLFEAANGGDIFLDEIGELSLDLQAKFLRVLQDKMVRRVGSDKERPLDIRIIAATNLDLLEAVNQKEFREDLFYRLNVHQVGLPTLRERTGDIEELFGIFMAENNFSDVKFAEGAKKLILDFAWPGNVRQLKGFAEYLRSYLDPNNPVVKKEIVENWLGHNQLRSKIIPTIQAGGDPVTEVRKAIGEKKSLSIVSLMDGIQKTYVQAALQETGGNRSQSAKVLGISRQRLSNWLSEWGIF